MKRIAKIILSALCIIFILNVFNNYRVDSKTTDDISVVTKNKRYENPIELKNFPVYGQRKNNSCGLTTISMVYSFLEKTKSEEAMSQELNLENRKKGMLPKEFLKYIRLSLSRYDVTFKNDTPDSEVLRIIYSQLEKGIPVPTYFSTINDWDKPNYDTHFSAVTGIDMKSEKIIIANAYGFREEVQIRDFLDSLKYKNYKNKPVYLAISTFFGVIKKNNIYIINKG